MGWLIGESNCSGGGLGSGKDRWESVCVKGGRGEEEEGEGEGFWEKKSL